MGLKEKRIESGLTQKDAANLFGIKYRTYQNYENGVTSPEMDTAAAFARYFSCTIGDLFDLEEGNEPFLNTEESQLLEAFNSMSQQGKQAMLLIAGDLKDVFGCDKEQ